MLARGKTIGACEFRRAGARHVFDYQVQTGLAHHLYPQQLLVADLIDSLRAAGGQVRFGDQVTAIRRLDEPVVVTDQGEQAFRVVIGSDGFHGAARLAAVGTRCSGVDFGAQWLALLAEAPPFSELQNYGLHADGFAGHMHRTQTVSRFYLQVVPRSGAEAWDEQQIWDMLETRLAVAGQPLIRGPITERSILELRSYVTEPMQAGRLYLAGDAAHIVTPAGGKGMNLALQDADELTQAIVELYRSGNSAGLDAYSVTRLPQVWRAVEFSHWMLQLLLGDGSGTAGAGFHEGLRDARLRRLMEDDLFARAFALAYVGPDR